MRVLKGSGRYLRVQAWKNLAKASVCVVVVGLMFPSVLLFPLDPLWLKLALMGVSLVPLIGTAYYSRQYSIFKAGAQGEKQTVNALKSSLDDDYFLVNGVHIHGLGDVDHVVVGQNGVFVVETKNWSGEISCNSDRWQRAGKPIEASPSRQAKTNAHAIKKRLEASGAAPAGLWVEAVVVFTNKHAKLHVNGASCRVLSLSQLPSYIRHHERGMVLQRQQVERMAKQILKTQ
jgi:hypothetical protein